MVGEERITIVVAVAKVRLCSDAKKTSASNDTGAKPVPDYQPYQKTASSSPQDRASSRRKKLLQASSQNDVTPAHHQC